MTKLMDRVKRFMTSPQGRQATDQAKRMARDPENQAKARRIFERFRSHK
ncbi:hypothetical protein AB0K60_07835 [Thermopolyspora sp. NPDC052614]